MNGYAPGPSQSVEPPQPAQQGQPTPQVQELSIRIDRLVVDADEPIDGFAFQLALSSALKSVFEERGLPDGHRDAVHQPRVVLADLPVDQGQERRVGQTRETILAQALATRLYEGLIR